MKDAPDHEITSKSNHNVLLDNIFVLLQRVLPQHGLSRFAYRVARLRWLWWRRRVITWFIRHYGVDMAPADGDGWQDYPHFNAFFTRALKPGARPLAREADAVVSPVDGVVYAAGHTRRDRFVEAKGRHYTVDDLLGGDGTLAARFYDGPYLAAYLAPKDYHRVHMPLEGKLRLMRYVPGRLFSVNQATTGAIPGLFAVNERLVTVFDTQAGPMAVVLVGAMLVSAIETVWSEGIIGAGRGNRLRTWDYSGDGAAPHLARGEEMGRFNMGSTVIVLFGPGRVRWAQELGPRRVIRVGQQLGMVHPFGAQSTRDPA